MTRGFVTIATGKERYYILAENLLQSYRQFAGQRFPFAILCDKRNRHTDMFDDVIVMENAWCSYLDKLYLYDYLPYDETIFIDADSLAYEDLDKWWDYFQTADDFSLFGYMWQDLHSGRGWFDPDKLNEYCNKVEYIPDFNGGVYFMRRGDTCREVFQLARYFANHYAEYGFTGFSQPADEPVLALAMAILRCKPIDILENGLVFAPRRKQAYLDIAIPLAKRKGTDKAYRVSLVHWSNYLTRQAWYKFEVSKLARLQQGRCHGIGYWLLYRTHFLYYCMLPLNVRAFYHRLLGRVKRFLYS